ncbi:MAG: pyridoxamine 5'-phosphate oxidase family protein [Acidimicrobiia bacterium]
MDEMPERNHVDLRTERTTSRRKPERVVHDIETIERILDEGLYCHVGLIVDSQPFVVPTGYGRDGRTLYIHGSSASRMLMALSRRILLCPTVTLFDGLVLGRSAFRHSMNYRSVMTLCVAHQVRGAEKRADLK